MLEFHLSADRWIVSSEYSNDIVLSDLVSEYLFWKIFYRRTYEAHLKLHHCTEGRLFSKYQVIRSDYTGSDSTRCTVLKWNWSVRTNLRNQCVNDNCKTTRRVQYKTEFEMKLNNFDKIVVIIICAKMQLEKLKQNKSLSQDYFRSR